MPFKKRPAALDGDGHGILTKWLELMDRRLATPVGIQAAVLVAGTAAFSFVAVTAAARSGARGGQRA
jgi:hypothetical protein